MILARAKKKAAAGTRVPRPCLVMQNIRYISSCRLPDQPGERQSGELEVTHNAVLKCGQRELNLVKNYTGHEYDAVLGMYYAKARFYDAGNRRFISMDPVKGTQTDPISMVQYLYVKNNSLIYIDPTGEVIEEFRVWLSGEG